MSEKKKNVIWIFSDQQRGDSLSCNGDPNVSTPNLDIMSVNGVNVTSAVGGFPLCCPFRGSLLTSVYPHKCVPGHEYQLPPEMKTIAHAFNENNYDTAYFGKWHLDGFHERDGRAAMHYIPPERRGGFNRWLAFENNNSQWDCWVHGHDASKNEIENYRLPGYETDCLSDLLIDYIKEMGNNPDQPFFSVLSIQPPHNPYVAPAEWMKNYIPAQLTIKANVPPIKRIEDEARLVLAGYYAMIENMDWNIGRINDALKEAGLFEDTHVMFFSDHGDLAGSHGQFLKMSPYSESLNTPFIISGGHGPYNYINRRVNDAPINHVDIAPTSLGLCGIDAPDWMEGTDYSYLRCKDREAKNVPDSAYIQSVIPTKHGHSVDRPWRGIVTADGWKYVVLENQPFMMFNLNEDPLEMANHAFNTAYDDERKRLQARLAQWIEDTGDSFLLPSL